LADKSLNNFIPLDDKKATEFLAGHWPEGRAVGKRYQKESVLYRYITCMAQFVKSTSGLIYRFCQNIFVNQSTELLEEHEISVGIPDQIPRLATTEERRDAVECLKRKIPVRNIGDADCETCFENYIKCLTGIEVEIRTARAEEGGNTTDFPITFDAVFGTTKPAGSFLFIVSVDMSGMEKNNVFDLTFPVNFFDPEIQEGVKNILNTILERVIPSFCYWQFEVNLTGG